MTDSSALSLILNAITSYGTAILAVLSAILVVSLGYLVFRFGWNRVRQSTVVHYAGGKWRGRTWGGRVVNEDYRL